MNQLPTTFWGKTWYRLKRNRPAMIGLAIVALMILCAVFAPWLAPFGEGQQHPDALLQSPSAKFLLGTDQLGRDVLSRVLYGARVSMVIALTTSALAMIFGTLLGALSGYVGGRLDNVFFLWGLGGRKSGR